MRDAETVLVSVIIPCYNAQNFIVETLDSVCSQSHKNIEIIVVNDGSTDTSLQILNSYKHPIVILNIENSGVSHARNTGLETAKGDYIVFLDSDDVINPQFIESRLNQFKMDHVDVVGGLTIDNLKSGQLNVRKSVVEDLLNSILTYNQTLNTCPSSYLINAKKLKSSGIQYNETISCAADRLFLLDLIQNSFQFSIVRTDNSEMLYRVHESSMSHTITKKLLDDLKLYFNILKTRTFPSNTLKRITLAKNDLIVAGMNYQLKNYFQSINYLIRSFFRSPRVVINYFKDRNKSNKNTALNERA